MTRTRHTHWMDFFTAPLLQCLGSKGEYYSSSTTLGLFVSAVAVNIIL